LVVSKYSTIFDLSNKTNNKVMNVTNTTPATTTVRPLYQIAAEIKKTWKNVYFGAVPYLNAMSQLDKISDPYGVEDGKTQVVYFLANAQTWRDKKGEDNAKRIKAELKKLAGIK
jgi:CRISPR/Cas system CSM-associated protein Csm2 small subunit